MNTLNNGIIVENARKGAVDMTVEKEYFTIEEALMDIKSVLEGGYDGYLCELHHEVFNTDWYIIGTYEAKQALNQYGVFEAIEEIKTYEKDSFGEIYTDLSNPEKVANMLYYIKGEEAVSELISCLDKLKDAWNECVTKELRDMMVSVIEGMLE